MWPELISAVARVVVTQAAPAILPSPAGGPQVGLMTFMPYLMMFAVVYLLVLRPRATQEAQREAAQRQLLASLKKDDEVVTSCGMYGRIVVIEERVITLEVAERTRVKVLRERIGGLWQAATQTQLQKPGAP